MRKTVLLCMLLMATPATAAPAWTAELQSTGLQAHGDTTTTGNLLAYLQEGATIDAAPLGWTLAAADLRIEADRVDLAVSSNGAYYQHNPKTTTQHYTEAWMEGRDFKADYRFNVYPLQGEAAPSFSAVTGCGHLAASPEDTVTRDAYVKDTRTDAKIAVDTSRASAWTACGAGNVVVEGDMLITFWSGTLLAQDASRTDEYAAGPAQSPHDPVGVPGLSSRTELYVYARDAVLTLPARAPHTAFLEDAVVHSEGEIVFMHAKGTMQAAAGLLEVQAESIVIAGNLSAQTGRQAAEGLAFQVSGTPDSARLDGESVQLLATASVPAPTPVWPWLLVAVALAGFLLYRFPTAYYKHMVASGAYLGQTQPRTRRERRAMGYWAIARYLEQRNRYRSAMALTRMGERLAPLLPDHVMLRAVLYMEQDEHEAAYGALRKADPLIADAEGRAQNALELAGVCMLTGRSSEAKSWIHLANTLSPDVVEAAKPSEARANRPHDSDPSIA